MTLKERSAEGMCPHPNLSRTSARWSRRSAIFLVAITAVSAAFAQGRSEEARREHPAPTQISLDPENPEYQITENGPHHRKWERVEKRVNERGEEEEIIHHYTELGTGLNRWDEEKAEWVESSNVIEAFEGGAVAQGGQTKVIFSPILGDAAGTVDILTADGKRIRTVVIGLAYYDPVSGEAILLSEVNPDVEGEIIPPNRVIYRNAFTDIKADVIYEYHRDRFSQNVVIYEAFESPGALGLSELARLEVLSEILESPRPQIKERVLEAFSTDPVQRGKMAEADLVDESLFFGESFMGQGIAFELGGTIETRSVVTKRLIEEGGRRILIEGVGYTDAKGYLDKLPRTIVKPRKSRASTDGVGPSRSREIPQRRLAQGTRAEDSPLRMAALDTAPQSGFLIDYELVSGSLNDYRFETGTTYFLDNTTVQLAGDTIFEGGAVIKMLNSYMILNDLAAFQTSAYQPLLVTSRDDDTVGETIAGSNGQPSVDDSIAFLMQPLGGQLIEHVRIKYSYIGIYSSNPSNLTIRDFQITDCFYPAAFFSGSGVSFENGLITDSFMLTCGASNTKGINLTLHDLDEFYISSNELTNCLLVDVDIIHPYGRQGSADNVELSSSSGVFQTAGGGHYYLAANSPYRDIGTSSIDPNLLADLESRTTYPPAVLPDPTTLTADTTWSPHVARDDDGNLDIGYHYTPLDYLFREIKLAPHVELEVEAGSSIAQMGQGFGIVFEDGSAIRFLGNPLSRIQYTRFDNVQESESGLVDGFHRFFLAWIAGGMLLPGREIDIRHTDFYAGPLDTTALFLHVGPWYGSISHMVVSDSSFHGGSFLYWEDPGLELTIKNSLFFRTQINMWGEHPLSFRNNLIRGGFIEMSQSSGADQWVIQDNFFDGADDPGASTVANGLLGYNAYLDTSFRVNQSTQTSDIVLTSFTYETGPFGDYYQPSTSPLIDAGSQPADAAGLLHHTVLATGPPEGTATSVTTVDIGLHYPAVDSGTGALLDQDGDGYANVLEDLNGNGQYDSGESNWQTVTSGLQVFTPLK